MATREQIQATKLVYRCISGEFLPNASLVLNHVVTLKSKVEQGNKWDEDHEEWLQKVTVIQVIQERKNKALWLADKWVEAGRLQARPHLSAPWAPRGGRIEPRESNMVQAARQQKNSTDIPWVSMGFKFWHVFNPIIVRSRNHETKML